MCFWWRVRSRNELYSECISAVKIKTVLLKSNIFFPIFAPGSGNAFFFRGKEALEPLLNKGFELPVGCFERYFFFSVEPPFGCRPLHEGIDVTHAHQVPDAL